MLSETTYNLTAKITLFPTDKGGRKRPVYSGYKPLFSFNTEKHYCGEVELLDKSELNPGETSNVFIKLLPAKSIRKNLKRNDAFTITEGNKTIGTGVIEIAELKEEKAGAQLTTSSTSE